MGAKDRDNGRVINLRKLFHLFLQEARQLSSERLGADINPSILLCCSLGLGMIVTVNVRN